MFKRIIFVNGWPTTAGKNGATIYTDIVLHAFSNLFPAIQIASMQSCNNPGYRRRFRSLIHRIFGYLTTLHPWGALKTIPAHIDRALPRSEAPSLLVINHISQGWATHCKRNGNYTHLVYIAHNIETDLKREQKHQARTLMYFAHLIELIRLAKYERDLFSLSDMVITISEQDRMRATQLGAKNAIVISPVSLNIPIATESDGLNIIRHNSPPTVLILSSFYWSVKRENMRKFLRRAHHVFLQYGVQLRVSGRMSASFERELQKYGSHIEVVRNPVSVTPVAASCQAAMLIDEVGGGFKLSTLTYFEEGLPIFALRKAVAAEALPLVNTFDNVVELAEAACRYTLAPSEEAVVIGNQRTAHLNRFRSHQTNNNTLKIAIHQMGLT